MDKQSNPYLLVWLAWNLLVAVAVAVAVLLLLYFHGL
jgi:hypothetical protein